ncbi:TPA: anti sigma factor C-terminal domain-containing protein [Streptococcus suis]
MKMISFEIATKKNKRKQLWKTVLLASCLVFTLLVSGIFALRIFSDYRSKQAEELFDATFQVAYPNVEPNMTFVNQTGIVSGYIDYSLLKNLAGVPIAFGHLEVEYSIYGIFSNFGQYFPLTSGDYQYHQDSNSKIPVFYNTECLDNRAGNELSFVKEMQGQLVEIAITFDRKYTFREIKDMIPSNLKKNWYWIGTNSSQTRVEDLPLVSIFGMDSDDVVAVTQEEYSDMQFPYKSPINAMKTLLEYNGNYSLSPSARGILESYVDKFGETDFTKQEDINKLEFAGIILTGKAEDFGQLEGKQWVYASSIGATIPMQPYYQLDY